MNIAVLGFGTVGSGIYEILKKNRESIKTNAGEEINIKYILDIRDFSAHEDAHLFTNDYNVILNDSTVDVVAEVIGGISPSYDFTRDALLSGKSVVTSNKELVATHGAELFKIAGENDVFYLFEAAVGGGIPLIHPMANCLGANRITRIMGILNGTTNYILSKMINEGKRFDEALARAQEKGYAERNPEADIMGHDTCRKTAILSSLAFGRQVDYKLINTQGITEIDPDDVKYAEALGCVIKLVGYSEISEAGVFARVSPMFLSKAHPLACADNVFNAALLTGDCVGDVMFYGKGAGKLPTASAVLGDIMDIAAGSARRIQWNAGCEGEALASAATGAFVRVKASDCENFKASYPEAAPIDAGIAGEMGYLIPEISEDELAGICAAKIIRTEKNFLK